MQCKWTFTKRFTLSTPQKCPIRRQQSQNLRFVGRNGSFSLVLFTKPFKTAWLTAAAVSTGATPNDFSLDQVIFGQT